MVKKKMNDFIHGIINEAHACLISGDEGLLDKGVSMLNSINLRVVEKDLVDKINTKRSQVDKKFEADLKSIKGNEPDPMKQRSDVVRLKKWQLSEYISFYDRLNKEYDL